MLQDNFLLFLGESTPMAGKHFQGRFEVLSLIILIGC
jgi:hypothetical protein